MLLYKNSTRLGSHWIVVERTVRMIPGFPGFCLHTDGHRFNHAERSIAVLFLEVPSRPVLYVLILEDGPPTRTVESDMRHATTLDRSQQHFQASIKASNSATRLLRRSHLPVSLDVLFWVNEQQNDNVVYMV